MKTNGNSNDGLDIDGSGPSDTKSISERVVKGVCDALDADVTDVEQLYTFVDPDALENLFAPTSDGPRAKGKIMFTMADCDVVVDNTGAVDVTPPGHGDLEAIPVEGTVVNESAGSASK